MNKRIKKWLIAGLSSFLLVSTSCDDYLDKNPDDRTQLDSKEKIGKLLVAAYPVDNYGVIAELSGDNFIDNNHYIAVVKKNTSPNLSARYAIHDEIFRWKPIVASMNQDSPTSLWQGYYKGIAVANEALAAIQDLENQGYGKDLSAEKGEALVCRAYCHFILVNIFCHAYKDSIRSLNDLGIPYALQPEDVVLVDYRRSTVTEVYANIARDIEEGFRYIGNQYDQPKYHFTKKAAAAFAARFYLYKRDYAKALEYADFVLGDNPASDMRDWSQSYADGAKGFGYDYIDASHNCNLLILPTRSQFNVIFGSVYGHNGDALEGTLYGTGPAWSGTTLLPAFSGKLYISGSQDYGAFIPKYYGMFEYVDLVAGTGYNRVVRVEFTTGETLLCRAEAKIYLGDIDGAVDDLQVWCKSYLAPDKLTADVIRSFYRKTSSNAHLFVKAFHTEQLSPDFIVTEEQKPFIDCILHFRRIETIFEGLRWFDIKRYGIEISHATGTDNTLIHLPYDDPRRAIQLPESVVASGMEANPRND